MTQATDYESMYGDLLQFLYRTPWGLIQTARDGTIQMINPVAAKILMQLTQNGRLGNIFHLLQSVRPELTDLVRKSEARYGVVCEDLPLHTGQAVALSLSIFVQNEASLMMVLRESHLPFNRGKLEASGGVLDALMNHPLIGLITTRHSLITQANATAQRLLGADAKELVGSRLEDLPLGDEVQTLLEESLSQLMAGARFEGLVCLNVDGQQRTLSVTADPPGAWDEDARWLLVEVC